MNSGPAPDLAIGSFTDRGPWVVEPDKMAHWIAPPARGIDTLPWQYEYVKRAV